MCVKKNYYEKIENRKSILIKKINLLILLIITSTGFSQIKIGNNPNSINANSVLEIESTNKGLLIPRMALSATTNASPLANHVEGMTVYNTATAGTDPTNVVPGYYYNDGTKWCRMEYSDLSDLDNEGGPVIDNTITSPPTDPDGGDNYIVPSGATGAWAGQTNKIAEFDEDADAWQFTTPATNERRVITEGTNAGKTYKFNGTTWVLISSIPPKSPFWRLGGNYTTAKNNKLGTLNNNHLHFVTAGRERMRILKTGNIAIGGAGAAMRLTINKGGLLVKGKGTANSQGAQMVWNDATQSGGGGLGYTNFVNHRGIGTGGFTFSTTNNNTSFTQYMKMASNGNILIGGVATDNPSQKLQVDGGVRFSGALMPNNNSGTSGQVLMSSGSGSAPTWNTLNNYQYEAENGMYSLATAVGGTITYKARLGGSLIENTTISQGIRTLSFTSSVTNGFSVDGSTFSVDAANNRIGIGTATPGSKLDVFGDVSLNNNALQIRGAGDSNHSLQYDWGIDGPLLKGYAGGALGTSNGANAVNWNNSGNVGIGTAANSTIRLAVSGSIHQNGNAFAQPQGTYITWNNALVQGSTGLGMTGFVCSKGAGLGGFVFGRTTDGTNFEEHMRIRGENGRVGIGTNNPDALLSVNGTASKSGGGSWSTFSDVRVKNDIKPFNDGLDILMKLNPVTFKYNVKSGYSDLNKVHVGFIAQEVEKVTPYMVSTLDDSKGPSGLSDKRQFDESALTKIIVNAIQEQQEMINKQQELINQLAKQIEQLNLKIEELDKK